MKAWPTISAERAAYVYREMLVFRRNFCADNDFIKMPAIWEDLCDEEGRWTIKTYKSPETEDYKRRAGVMLLGERCTLTVDEQLFHLAKKGCWLSNFTLAHELGHVALGHHSRQAVTKNFQLFAGPKGMSNIPPTPEELETNYAAAFLQCGIALEDRRLSALDLARRAYSDPLYVEKAQKVLRLDVVKNILARPKRVFPRAIL